MTKKKSGLGRGLEALLRDVNIQAPLSAATAHHTTSNDEVSHSSNHDQLLYLPVESLHRGRYQPRQEISEQSLVELAESIQSQGVIQPILVSETAPRHYEIIAGERRWRAAQLAGLVKVPVIIRNLDTKAAMAVALIENIQREDLNPLDTALGLQRLLHECALTHQELAHALGKSRSTISNLLRLLELNDSVKRLLADGALEMGHARALLSLSSMQQLRVATQVIKERLSVRQTEQLVAKQQQSAAKKVLTSRSNHLDPNVARLQTSLAEYLGAAVSIKTNPKGHGELVIKYFSHDELSGILERIFQEDTLSFP